MNKTRLEAFSDGVIAIIITIMVLEIKVPHGNSFASLRPIGIPFLCYLLSFIYIGIYWGNHHHLIQTVKRVTAGMIWANLSLLFLLSMIPFTTDWMGENHFSTYTVILYAINLLICGLAFSILQYTVESNRISTSEMTNAFANLKRKGVVSSLFYIVSIPLAFVNTLFSGIIFVMVALIWLVPDKHIAKAIPNADSVSD